MPAGLGKYDALATYVREQAEATGVAVIVLDGSRGDGFAVQMTAEQIAALPRVLRLMADQIERGTVNGIERYDA